MCLKPQPPRPMPPELAAWGARHLADLYHEQSKSDLSPVLLAFVIAF